MLTRRRKTRKLHRNQRGGNPNLDDELVETLDELNLLYIPSIDDGNCFFYTLESFFSIRKKDMGNYVKIRKTIIDHMRSEKGTMMEFLNLANVNNTEKFFNTELKALAKSGAWDSQLGDFVSQMAPAALNINIKVYDWDGDALIIYNNDVPTATDAVHMLRTNENHYDLLLPLTNLAENTPNILQNINKKLKTRTKAKTYKSRK
jgi:hypothetical protein